MEKINYIPYGLLFAFSTHALLQSFNINSVLVIIGLLAFIFGKEFLEKNAKLKDVIHTVNEQNKIIEKMAKEVDSVRTSVVGMKMQNGMKKVI